MTAAQADAILVYVDRLTAVKMYEMASYGVIAGVLLLVCAILAARK